jgi:hypothetical protein
MITRLESISGVIISMVASSGQHTNNYTTDTSCLVIMIYHTRRQHTNNYTTDTSFSGAIISVLASSVVNHDYKAGSISGVIISVLASSGGLVIMIYHTRSQHTNNYTTDTSSLVIMI